MSQTVIIPDLDLNTFDRHNILDQLTMCSVDIISSVTDTLTGESIREPKSFEAFFALYSSKNFAVILPYKIPDSYRNLITIGIENNLGENQPISLVKLHYTYCASIGSDFQIDNNIINTIFKANLDQYPDCNISSIINPNYTDNHPLSCKRIIKIEYVDPDYGLLEITIKPIMEGDIQSNSIYQTKILTNIFLGNWELNDNYKTQEDYHFMYKISLIDDVGSYIYGPKTFIPIISKVPGIMLIPINMVNVMQYGKMKLNGISKKSLSVIKKLEVSFIKYKKIDNETFVVSDIDDKSSFIYIINNNIAKIEYDDMLKILKDLFNISYVYKDKESYIGTTTTKIKSMIYKK